MTELNLQRVSDEEAQGAEESALEQIRAMYQRASRERRLALPVPGEMGKLVKVRYRPRRNEFEIVEGRSGDDTNLDLLIYLCDAILVRTGAGWEPLTKDGDPVLFYPTALNELLGIDVRPREEGGTAREAVLALFAGAGDAHAAVEDHIERIGRWMRTGAHRVNEEEFLGES